MPDTNYWKDAFEKHVNGTFSEQERLEFLENLANSAEAPEAEQAISQMVLESKENLSLEEWEIRKMLGMITGPVRKNARVVRLLQRSLSIAAILVLLIGAWWIFQRDKNEGNTSTGISKHIENDVKPATVGALLHLSDGRTINLDSASQGMIADGFTKTGGTLSVQESRVEYARLEVPRGKTMAAQLSDGTRVWLNAGSSLSFPTVFTGGERKVKIDGEVYFEVAANARKPFMVEKDGFTVRVLGTHFNINAYSDEAEIKVTLLEGSVNVSNGKAASLLKPGQQARIMESIEVVNDVDVDQVMSWRNGIFILDHADLPSLMRQISRWYDVNVVYESKIPDIKFGGGVSKNLPLSKVLESLESHGIHFQLEGKTLKVK